MLLVYSRSRCKRVAETSTPHRCRASDRYYIFTTKTVYYLCIRGTHAIDFPSADRNPVKSFFSFVRFSHARYVFFSDRSKLMSIRWSTSRSVVVSRRTGPICLSMRCCDRARRYKTFLSFSVITASNRARKRTLSRFITTTSRREEKIKKKKKSMSVRRHVAGTGVLLV